MAQLSFVQRVLGPAAVVGFAALMAASPAQANVNKTNLTVAYVGPESCAVQVGIDDVEDNLFNGAEYLALDGMMLGGFGPLMSSTSSLSASDYVLYGTTQFELDAGISVDLMLDPSVCAGFVPNATFEFYGSFGPVAGSLVLPEAFGVNFAFSEFAGLTDLEVAAILLFNLSGDEVTLGTGTAEDPRGGSSKGCSTTGDAPVGWLGLLAILGLLRRRRSEVRG